MAFDFYNYVDLLDSIVKITKKDLDSYEKLSLETVKTLASLENYDDDKLIMKFVWYLKFAHDQIDECKKRLEFLTKKALEGRGDD